MLILFSSCKYKSVSKTYSFILATYKRQKCDDCGWKPDTITETKTGWKTPFSSDNEEESPSSHGALVKDGRSTQQLEHKLQLIKRTDSFDIIEAVPHFDGAFDPTPFEPPSPPKPKVKGRVKAPGYMKLLKHPLQLTKPYTNRVRYILSRDRPRFFDQLGHQSTNASVGNKHFFTK